MTIENLVYAAKHNLKIIILCIAVITSLFAGICFYIIPPEYQISTKLFVDRNKEKNTYDYNEMQVNEKLLKTYIEIIESRDFINNAIESNNINLSVEEVSKNLMINTQNGTQVMTIAYTYNYKDAEQAKKVLSSIQNKFCDYIQELVPNSRIEIIENLNESKYPIAPNKKVWILAGFLLGIFIGCLAALIKECKMDRFKSRKMIEENLKLPVLGVIVHANKMGE
ncbi:MAG: YveK family protein [Clostridium sp.]